MCLWCKLSDKDLSIWLSFCTISDRICENAFVSFRTADDVLKEVHPDSGDSNKKNEETSQSVKDLRADLEVLRANLSNEKNKETSRVHVIPLRMKETNAAIFSALRGSSWFNLALIFRQHSQTIR